LRCCSLRAAVRRARGLSRRAAAAPLGTEARAAAVARAVRAVRVRPPEVPDHRAAVRVRPPEVPGRRAAARLRSCPTARKPSSKGRPVPYRARIVEGRAATPGRQNRSVRTEPGRMSASFRADRTPTMLPNARTPSAAGRPRRAARKTSRTVPASPTAIQVSAARRATVLLLLQLQHLRRVVVCVLSPVPPQAHGEIPHRTRPHLADHDDPRPEIPFGRVRLRQPDPPRSIGLTWPTRDKSRRARPSRADRRSDGNPSCS
jgi:hypothetical protein